MGVQPKFSIIIPVYNAEKYLPKCIDSLIKQTFKKFEIICINDGSSDKSLNILKRYATNDTRIKIFTQKNSGPAVARNLGLEKAQGKYLWFIDADDWIEEKACEILNNIINKNSPDITIFASNVYNTQSKEFIHDKNRSLMDISDKYIEKKINLDSFPNIFDYIPTEAWNKIYKSDFIKNNEILFNKNIYGMDDGLFTEETVIKSSSLYITKNALYNYRVSNANSIVHYLLNLNLKNYNTTIEYSKLTFKMIKPLSLSIDVINSLCFKNICRMLYYASRAHGYVRILYIYHMKKHVKAMLKCYPFLKDNKELMIKIKKIFDSKINLLSNIKWFLYRKENISQLVDFYNVSKTKYYFMGKCFLKKSKREINLIAFQNSIITKCQRSINAAYTNNQTFSEFKNCHNKKTIVLVGAGPTVGQFSPIKNSIYVACNRAILLDSVTFDYIFAIDKIGLDAISKELIHYKNEKCIKFIGDINYGIKYQIPEDFRLLCNSRPYKTTCGMVSSKFSLDIDKEPLGSFHSVAFQAMQFILFTNPQKVYLVGMDCSSNGAHFAGKEHFVSDRGEDIKNLEKLQINDWKLLKQFQETYYPNVEIISVNPVGLRGVFKDVYTKAYLREHPEMNKNTVEILKE
ncbi:MAG: glycosyltransferase [Alphaproteobacteria bacterium]|nr:glycosyltransferase [Alphaproteobacteria bacterium]